MDSRLWFRVISSTACVLALSFQVSATQLCRWTDETGRTQISDQVPAKYRHLAKCTDSHQYEPTDAQRREAEARAQTARETEVKAQAAREAGAKAKAAAAKAPSGDSQTAAQDDKPSKPAPASSTQECATLHRLFRESQECFAAFRVANASVREEAFSKCTEVFDPSPQCGPPPSVDALE